MCLPPSVMAFSKKYFTLIIVPDATSHFRQMKVPYLLTRGILALTVLLLLGGAATAYYMARRYQDMTLMIRDLPEIRKTTRSQKTLIDHYEKDAMELRQVVSRLKLVNAKLMLMAGVENPIGEEINFSVGGDGSFEFASIVESFERKTEASMKEKVENLETLKASAADQEELSQRLMEFFQDQQTLLASTPSIWPVRGWVTSGFGKRKSPFTGRQSMHYGLDISTKTGTPIVAPADGVVSYSDRKGAYGLVLVIDHGYGYSTFYGHCSKLGKSVGDKVKRGDVIAYVGNTGRSTGSHLHYEVRVRGVATNPTKHIIDF